MPFGTKAKQSLVEWLKIYRIWQGGFGADSAVFISQKGNALTPRQIENRVKLQAQQAGNQCRFASTFITTLFCQPFAFRQW